MLVNKECTYQLTLTKKKLIFREIITPEYRSKIPLKFDFENQISDFFGYLTSLVFPSSLPGKLSAFRKSKQQHN